MSTKEVVHQRRVWWRGWHEWKDHNEKKKIILHTMHRELQIGKTFVIEIMMTTRIVGSYTVD